MEVRRNIKGVLVEHVDPSNEEERKWTRGYAPGVAHEEGITGGWTGGIDATHMDFSGTPMMLLNKESTNMARERAEANARLRANGGSSGLGASLGGRSGEVWHARIRERMSGLGRRPTLEPPNSVTCLEAGTCLPLGGYSVVASSPPLSKTPTPVGTAQKDVILVVARTDADGFFRDANPAINYRMSGVIGLLAVAESLRDYFLDLEEAQFAYPVVFMALSGEDFGHLGSSRIASAWLDAASNATSSRLPELRGRQVRAMIEIGPIGFADSYTSVEVTPTMFAHSHGSTMVERLEQMAASFQYDITVNQGVADVKESAKDAFVSLQSPDYEYVYVSEDEDAPLDPHAGTHLDAGLGRTINQERIQNTAQIIANLVRSITATGDANEAGPQVNTDSIRSSVSELSQCFANPLRGLERCSLGARLLYGEQETALVGVDARDPDPLDIPTRYPDALTRLAEDEQSHDDKNALTRFLWNYLAEVTSQTVAPTACARNGVCAGAQEVCVGRTDIAPGECHEASPEYVLSLSPQLSFSHVERVWKVNRGLGSAEEPLWTESNWSPSIGVTLYKPDGGLFSRVHAIAVGGMCVVVVVLSACACAARRKKSTLPERRGLLS